jgi:hypothetical protein
MRKLDFPDNFLEKRDQPRDHLRDRLATRSRKRQFLLDTEAASRLMRAQRSIVARMRQSGAKAISISSVTTAELLYGARLREVNPSVMSAVRAHNPPPNKPLQPMGIGQFGTCSAYCCYPGITAASLAS